MIPPQTIHIVFHWHLASGTAHIIVECQWVFCLQYGFQLKPSDNTTSSSLVPTPQLEVQHKSFFPFAIGCHLLTLQILNSHSYIVALIVFPLLFHFLFTISLTY